MRRLILAALATMACALVPATASATPTVNFSFAPSAPTAGRPVTFKSTGTCDRTPCTYRWTDPGDGQLFSTSSTGFSFTYHGTGTRSVQLTVRNARSQSASKTRSFTVSSATPPPADQDGDGVPDSSDQCPTQAGPASNNGCPVVTPPADQDGDGVPDSSDQCPTQAGPASNNGCPVPPPPTDTDGDGVPDSSDQCPTQAGPASNNGCPVVTPPGGNNCMPVPSACGFPDMTNTGTLPGVARTAASGVVTLSTAGQVYENKTVTGRIVVTAANVTIRNVKVSSNGGWSIRCRTQEGACKNLVIQDTEIQMNGDVDDYGIVGQSFTATRVQIHGGADCIYYESNVAVHDSFCSLGPDTNDDGWADSTTFCDPNGPHFDGFSSDGGANQVYDHNTIRNPCSQTSAILISTNSSTISNVTITNNLMAGGGYTLYCDAGPNVQGSEVVTGNRVAKTYWPQGGYYGPAANCGGSSMTYSGNVWDDTGQPLG